MMEKKLRNENVLVTKLVPNSVTRRRIGRYAPTRAADFSIQFMTWKDDGVRTGMAANEF